jgi:hypothetical protein
VRADESRSARNNRCSPSHRRWSTSRVCSPAAAAAAASARSYLAAWAAFVHAPLRGCS